MQENWRAVCAYAAAIYMVLIFGGQQYMAARPRLVGDTSVFHKMSLFYSSTIYPQSHGASKF